LGLHPPSVWMTTTSSPMRSVRPSLSEQTHGLWPDTVKGDALIEVRGVGHAPRIGTASSGRLSDTRAHTDDVASAMASGAEIIADRTDIPSA